MRFAVVILVVLSVALLTWAQTSPANWYDIFSKNEKLCRKENNISDTEKIEELTKNSKSKHKCYVKCQYLKNIGEQITNKDNFINKVMKMFTDMNAAVIKKRGQSMVDQHRTIVKQCYPKNAKNDCDTYCNFSLCTSEEYRAMSTSSSTPS
ncbi:uncharacterized protein LOC135943287 [Cloeon dipterum]|uniref:uncharacterized protein LOC135943287 n=1 Tax=Cloeon dipterum TaxID=197152 RepID=UPI0032209C16